MTPTSWVLLIVAIVVAVLFTLQVRTKKGRLRNDPEYDRTAREQGSARGIGREPEKRNKGMDFPGIRRFSDEESGRFAAEWRAAQCTFVDDPRRAVAAADELVHRAMTVSGCPMAADPEARAAELALRYGVVAENYRIAHELAAPAGGASPSTEDLRLAMKNYRVLFEELLRRSVEETAGVRR